MRRVRGLVSVWIGVLVLAGPVPADEDAKDFAPIADLAGSCWAGTFENGARDVHCYEWVLDEGFVRDRHEVRSPGSDDVYAGVTYFGWDREVGALTYRYFNTLGGVSEGKVASSDDGWLFHETYGGAGADQAIRTRMTRPGDDLYTVKTEFLRDDGWVVEADLTYHRLAPAGGATRDEVGCLALPAELVAEPASGAEPGS